MSTTIVWGVKSALLRQLSFHGMIVMKVLEYCGVFITWTAVEADLVIVI